MRSFRLYASFFSSILLLVIVLISPSPVVAVEHCGGDSCVRVSNNIQIENNNSNVNRNENVQVVEVNNPREEVVTVTEGGTPVYEEIVEIVETPPTGSGALSLLVLVPLSISGLLLRKASSFLPS